MTFSLMINPTERLRECFNQSLELAQAISEAGHSVSAVFFYSTGVQIINDQEMVTKWQHWQSTTQTPLLLCSSIIEHMQLGHIADQTMGFQTVSMGRWIQAAEAADKHIELN